MPPSDVDTYHEMILSRFFLGWGPVVGHSPSEAVAVGV